QPPAIENPMAGKVGKAVAAIRFLPEQSTLQIFRIDQILRVSLQQRHSVQTRHQRVLRLLRDLKRLQPLPVTGQQKPRILLRKRLQPQWLHRSLSRFGAEPGEPLKLAESRRTDPLEKSAAQFSSYLARVHLAVPQWTRLPQAVSISLLIEPSIHRHA